jgi:hypothetical protein
MRVALPLLARSHLLLALFARELVFEPELFLEPPKSFLLVFRRCRLRRCRHGRFLGRDP